MRATSAGLSPHPRDVTIGSQWRRGPSKASAVALLHTRGHHLDLRPPPRWRLGARSGRSPAQRKGYHSPGCGDPAPSAGEHQCAAAPLPCEDANPQRRPHFIPETLSLPAGEGLLDPGTKWMPAGHPQFRLLGSASEWDCGYAGKALSHWVREGALSPERLFLLLSVSNPNDSPCRTQDPGFKDLAGTLHDQRPSLDLTHTL